MPLAPVETLQLRVNSDSNIPPYAQLANQLNCIVTSGRLRPGDLLPPIRKLARRLNLNPNTVARAYAELAKLGRLDKRVGSGCFVARAQPFRNQEDRLELLADRIEELINDAQGMGITTESLLRAVQKAGVQATGGGTTGNSESDPSPSRNARKKPPEPPAKPESVSGISASLWPDSGFVD